MDAVQFAYLVYFTALQLAGILWALSLPLTGACVALSVVALHFLLGGFRVFRGGFPVVKERYMRLGNAFADILLSLSLVALSLVAAHPDSSDEWFTVGLLSAVIGNSFCIWETFHPFIAPPEINSRAERFLSVGQFSAL